MAQWCDDPAGQSAFFAPSPNKDSINRAKAGPAFFLRIMGLPRADLKNREQTWC
jgi:hypothetical protein